MNPDEQQPDEKKDAPKRDKFAAMALRQQEQSTATATTESAPKRDKFAAMAAMQSEDNTETTTGGHRDKFASVAAQQVWQDHSLANNLVESCSSV